MRAPNAETVRRTADRHAFVQRRQWLGMLAGLVGAGVTGGTALAQGKPRVEVWKDPQCGCCKDWVDHMQANGFVVQVHDSGNAQARKRLGIPEQLGSCHTAQVGGYAIEGHVPARDVQRLLRERPAAIGLSVPGMPVGSPGMDGPAYGGRKDRFDVVLIQSGGTGTVYQSYNTR